MRRGGSYREVEGGRGEEEWRWAGMYTARERRHCIVTNILLALAWALI
jgi:hypothetical protein